MDMIWKVPVNKATISTSRCCISMDVCTFIVFHAKYDDTNAFCYCEDCFKKQTVPEGQHTNSVFHFLKIIGFEPRLLKTFRKVFFRTRSHGLIWFIMRFILST